MFAFDTRKKAKKSVGCGEKDEKETGVTVCDYKVLLIMLPACKTTEPIIKYTALLASTIG